MSVMQSPNQTKQNPPNNTPSPNKRRKLKHPSKKGKPTRTPPPEKKKNSPPKTNKQTKKANKINKN